MVRDSHEVCEERSEVVVVVGRRKSVSQVETLARDSLVHSTACLAAISHTSLEDSGDYMSVHGPVGYLRRGLVDRLIANNQVVKQITSFRDGRGEFVGQEGVSDLSTFAHDCGPDR